MIVLNLCFFQLSRDETSLYKGLNFAAAPKRIGPEKITRPVESLIRSLPVLEGYEIRFETSEILRGTKQLSANISKRENIGLKNLKSNLISLRSSVIMYP